MGKARARKHKQRGNNPIGIPSSSAADVLEVPFPLDKHAVLSADTMKALSCQLQSASLEDRDCACHALVGLIRNSDDSHAALHEGLIKVLGPLLLDTSPSVCHSAASALRTIVFIGGDSAVKLAMNHDIMTPLVALLKRIPSEWKPHKNPGEKIDTSKATFVECVDTLSLLCESSTLAVDRMHRESIVSLLINYLDQQAYGPDVVVSVAQFLSTVTEDQGDVEYVPVLKEKIVSGITSAETSTCFLKTLGTMVLLNLNRQCFDAALGMSAQDVVNILQSALNQDHRKAASLIVDYLPITNGADDEDENLTMEDTPRGAKLQEALDAAEQLLCSQIKSLEILTNLCCPVDSDSELDELYHDESEWSEASIDGIEESPIELNAELKAAFLNSNLFGLVVERAKLPAENVVEALSQHPSGKMLLKRYEILQCRAFLCLSNMVTTLDVDDVGGGKELFDIWCGLTLLAFQVEKSNQVLEAATASMRAIIQKLSQHQQSIVQLLKQEDITLLCQRVEQCTHAQAKVNLLQVLGTLGSMAAGTEPPLVEPQAGIVRGIANVLLETVCTHPDLWVVCEALDAVFDVFKEDHVDDVAIQVQLVERLRSIAPGFKHRVHAQRRNLPSDHLPIIMTAKDNLLRFIKYKATHRSGASR